MKNRAMMETSREYANRPTVLFGLFPSQTGFLTGISNQARKFGWRLVDLALTQNTIPRGYRIVGAIIGMPVDHPDMPCPPGGRWPVVRVGFLPHPEDHRVPAVIVDFPGAGRLAAEHFAARNFRHVGFVGHEIWSCAESMWSAFHCRAGELGLSCHLLRLAAAYTTAEHASRYERRLPEVGEWLKKLPRPVGIFCGSNKLAGGIITMANAVGLEVPDDIAVLGSGNNVLLCETAPIPLSVVDLGPERVGAESICLLDRLIRGMPPPSSPIVIPPAGVFERESTNVLAVPEPVVARAIRYIWDHLDLPVSVDHIAQQVGVSRSALDHAFQRCLGRSVNAERLRKRLEHCTELLRATDLPVEDVARAVGFASRSYLSRAFKNQFGVSPREFRSGR